MAELIWYRICLWCRRPRLDSWVRKICWRRDRPPTPVFLGFPGSAGEESTAVCEAWVRSLGWEGALEKGKPPHSGTLAWRTAWTVWSLGSQRVGQAERLSLHFAPLDRAASAVMAGSSGDRHPACSGPYARVPSGNVT